MTHRLSSPFCVRVSTGEREGGTLENSAELQNCQNNGDKPRKWIVNCCNSIQHDILTGQTWWFSLDKSQSGYLIQCGDGFQLKVLALVNSESCKEKCNCSDKGLQSQMPTA